MSGLKIFSFALTFFFIFKLNIALEVDAKVGEGKSLPLDLIDYIAVDPVDYSATKEFEAASEVNTSYPDDSNIDEKIDTPETVHTGIQNLIYEFPDNQDTIVFKQLPLDEQVSSDNLDDSVTEEEDESTLDYSEIPKNIKQVPEVSLEEFLSKNELTDEQLVDAELEIRDETDEASEIPLDLAPGRESFNGLEYTIDLGRDIKIITNDGFPNAEQLLTICEWINFALTESDTTVCDLALLSQVTGLNSKEKEVVEIEPIYETTWESDIPEYIDQNEMVEPTKFETNLSLNLFNKFNELCDNLANIFKFDICDGMKKVTVLKQ